MSTSMRAVLGILFALGYVVSPIMLIWGWVRWIKRPKQRSIVSILSLIGFVFATASGLLAVSSAVHAQAVHAFAYYDPLLLRIIRTGALLALAGTVFGIGGAWQPNTLRWYAPVSAAGMLVFWFLTALGE